MALRPIDLQVVLQATRDVERVQHLQQQYSRQQQEQLATYMQKNLEVKKKRTEPLDKAVETRIRPVSQEEKNTREERRRKKQERGEKKVGMHIDIIA